jgi:alkyl hydroperoxide reductase subunit AhpF
MLKIIPRTGRSILSSRASQVGPQNLRVKPAFQILSQPQSNRRGYATEAPDYDVIFIGGGVAGYVGAIKAGQEGLKVQFLAPQTF